jgi:hypothetical protein
MITLQMFVDVKFTFEIFYETIMITAVVYLKGAFAFF